MSVALRLRCKQCDHTFSYNKFVFSVRKKSGVENPCEECGANLNTEGVSPPKRGRTDDQKRSQAQEKLAAARHGAKVQPGSGAPAHSKGDIRDAGELRGECKFTRAKSFSLKLEELKKLEQEASSGELPIFEIEFQGVRPAKRYYVMPDWVYHTLKGDQ